jgi:hypothetical protein
MPAFEGRFSDPEALSVLLLVVNSSAGPRAFRVLLAIGLVRANSGHFTDSFMSDGSSVMWAF